MRTPKVRLSITTTRFVSPTDDPDHEPEAHSVLISAVTFRKALGLAETRTWFKSPRQHFLAAQTTDFGRALKEALAEKVEPGGVRASSRFTTLGQLREFFEQPAQKRALARLMAFVEVGCNLDVSSE
jgi:hypothetical protein